MAEISVATVDFPENRLFAEIEAAEVVFAVRVVVLREGVECRHLDKNAALRFLGKRCDP